MVTTKNLEKKEVFRKALPCFRFFQPSFSNFLHMAALHQLAFYLVFLAGVNDGQYGHHTLLSTGQRCFITLTNQAKR